MLRIKKCSHLWIKVNKIYKTCSLCKRKSKINKFGAVKKEYNGFIYDSTREADYAKLLDFKVKNKEIIKWDRQALFRFPLKCKYPPKLKLDFVTTNKDGSNDYIDAKGRKTAVYMIKKKMMEHFFGIKIKEV